MTEPLGLVHERILNEALACKKEGDLAQANRIVDRGGLPNHIRQQHGFAETQSGRPTIAKREKVLPGGQEY